MSHCVFDVNLAVYVKGQYDVPRRVCPECVEHKQTDPGKNGYDNDCKNEFTMVKHGVTITVGQCCCWSDVHDYYHKDFLGC